MPTGEPKTAMKVSVEVDVRHVPAGKVPTDGTTAWSSRLRPQGASVVLPVGARGEREDGTLVTARACRGRLVVSHDCAKSPRTPETLRVCPF